MTHGRLRSQRQTIKAWGGGQDENFRSWAAIRAALGKGQKVCYVWWDAVHLVCFWSNVVSGDRASSGHVIYGVFPHFESCYITVGHHLWWAPYKCISRDTFCFCSHGTFPLCILIWCQNRGTDSPSDRLLSSQCLNGLVSAPNLAWLAVYFNFQDPRSLARHFSQQSLTVLLSFMPASQTLLSTKETWGIPASSVESSSI